MDENELFSMDKGWWRSSTRIVINWLIIKGLLKHGFINIAQELMEKTLNLIKKCGFREAYHSQKDKGFGACSYSLSTLIIDLIHSFTEDTNESDFLMNKEWTRIKRLPDF